MARKKASSSRKKRPSPARRDTPTAAQLHELDEGWHDLITASVKRKPAAPAAKPKRKQK